MDFYKRLDKKYHYTDPVEHILGRTFRPVAEYDDLYENQTRFDGVVWTKFKETYNLKCQFHNDLQDIDFSKDITCLWFFRERADRDAGNDIKLADKVVAFQANVLFITPSKEIKIQKRKVFFPRRPCLQLEISNEIYLNIKKGLGIDE